MKKYYFVYIMASKKEGVIYIGVTSNLIKRVWEHKNKIYEGFSSKYQVNKLVYFEQFSDPINAIKREKRLKKYSRNWKKDLIEKDNPKWIDLYEEILPH